MGLLSEMEDRGESWLREELERGLQERLDEYRPECKGCGLTMQRHHTYGRSILSRHGELSLRIPVFRCGGCGEMASGAGLIGRKKGGGASQKGAPGGPEAGSAGVELPPGGMLLGLSKSSLCKWLRSEGVQARRCEGKCWSWMGCGHTRKLASGAKGAARRARGGGAVVWRLGRGAWAAVRAGSGDATARGERRGRGDREALGLVYGPELPHQLCQFHLLREYRRHFGACGWAQAKALLGSSSQAQAAALAEQVHELTRGRADYWCKRALLKGLTLLSTGHSRLKTTSSSNASSASCAAENASLPLVLP